MLYLISGRDEFGREEFVAQLKARMRQLPAGEHNIVELDSRASVAELITACNTTPFLCEKRMVIGRGIVGQQRRGDGLAQLTAYLPSLPAETHLVLVEEDDQALEPLTSSRADVVRRKFPRQSPQSLPRWIMDRARKHGGRITPQAAAALAEMVGGDLRLLDQELAKLVTYVGPQGAIGIEAVQELVHGAAPATFAWLDAVAERRPGAALATTQALLDVGNDPADLFAQLVALIRRLLVVKELIAEGRSVARDGPAFGLTTNSYAQDKLRRQASRWALADLDEVYDLLREIDLAVKTGRLEAELAIHLAVAQAVGLLPAAREPEPASALAAF